MQAERANILKLSLVEALSLVEDIKQMGNNKNRTGYTHSHIQGKHYIDFHLLEVHFLVQSFWVLQAPVQVQVLILVIYIHLPYLTVNLL